MENRIQIVMERGHLFSINDNVSMAARIHGRITKEIVSQALEKVIRKYPIFTSTIKREENQQAFYQLYSAKRVEPVYYPYGEANHLEAYLQKEEETAFDHVNGPLLRMIVFKGEERSLFVIIGSLMLSDAKGYQQFLEELVYYMNHSEEEPEPILPRLIGNGIDLPVESSLRLKDKFTINALNREWKKSAHTFSENEYKELFTRYKRTHKKPVIMKEINVKSTKSLFAYCEERHVSVTATIITAFLAVMYNFDRFHRNNEVRTEVMLNHRKKEESATIAPLSSQVMLLKKYSQGLSFWDNVEVVHGYLKEKEKDKYRYEKLAKMKALDGTLLESIPFAAYGEYENAASKKAAHLFYEGEKEKGLGVENLGETVYKKEEEFYIDLMYFIPTAKFTEDLSVGAVTVNEKLMLCIRYDKVHYSERIIEDMVRSAVNYMWNRS